MKTKQEVNKIVEDKIKEMKEVILNMTKTEVEIDTKYIVYFEDHGQDFLEFHINEEGYILDSRPCQRNIWAGHFTIPQTAKVGGKLAIYLDRKGESSINYPIKRIEESK